MSKLVRKNTLTIDSREIAEMLGKEHKALLKDIQGTETIVGIIPTLERENFTLSDYFIESSYKSGTRDYKCYLITKMGCELIGNKQQGAKGILFSAKYVQRFNEMESTIKQQQTKITSLTKQQEIEARLKNAKVREANIYLKIADKVQIPEYKQIMYSKATEVLSGEQLLPLPKAERKTFSAAEIGKKLGITSNMVGRLANKNNLKTNEYGINVWDKAKHCDKQVPTFRYYENVIPVFREML